jgi:hypothetical protein
MAARPDSATYPPPLVQGRVFATRFEAEIAVVEYLGWFNHTRLHASLDDLAPAEFEALSPPQNEPITYTIMSKEPTNPASTRPGTAHLKIPG